MLKVKQWFAFKLYDFADWLMDVAEEVIDSNDKNENEVDAYTSPVQTATYTITGKGYDRLK